MIELPIQGEERAEEAQQELDTVAPKPPQRTGKILVVDDEPMILDLLIDILGEAGHRVDSASNGTEACRKVGSHEYDVILSDMRLPHMSGMELYHEILRLRPSMRDRVIFMSGDLIDKETVRFLEQTGAPAVAKPIDIPEVLRAVASALVRASERAPQPT